MSSARLVISAINTLLRALNLAGRIANRKERK